ncbi:HEAT repeat domain-containing protein [Desertifilum sp. FACHB-1129]|uniref:Phycocyanin alpha phycocyanobilin lyase n=1 Tax=Desertifilum tharense IPPAS B-1220 TaxID=1781255 RepID=A0A1E5QF05_9CYAN|nr:MULTISPECIES: HEAT repeat domain-containing protein [Desertifilum]MDA0212898.1 HEAT repeat domain-containing protein [Cyanobacteria bacterium FC1]MDI9638643.1 HEAT repeat domain-containing protein [Geitlerinema splendidum]MBD2312534.1 HEAT repeat domain-containing protein [Desertifilum sp. FACHB-1129]MBD2323476.1 HEAT repeat domain-containing protein [Desertifilum sp. FACHB-866]MBD2333321.1 HEAT repeat domain-containing protein [Desertifilum sp. FACHB-868]
MSVTPESVQQLLSSDDYGDRLRGVNQLRELDPAIAFEMIQPATNDPNVRVRYAAVSQVSSLGEQDRQVALELLRDRLLNDPEADVKAAAADSLGALHLTEAYPELEQIYQESSEWLVKFSILAALGELGDLRAFDLLKQGLSASTELEQTAAISALGELGDPRAVSLLIPFATNPDWQIRYRVVQALHRLGTSEAQTTLEQLTRDEVAQVAQEAKNSLSTM